MRGERVLSWDDILLKAVVIITFNQALLIKLYSLSLTALLLNGFKLSKKQLKGSLNDSKNLGDIFAKGLSSPDCNICTQAAIRFLQWSTKFYNCIEMAIRFFTAKCKILKTVPER